MPDYYTPLNASEQKILHHIAVHQPVYGRKIRFDTGMPQGTVYSSLGKLVAKGLITGEHEEGDDREERGGQGPARVLYTIPKNILDHFPFLRVLVIKKIKSLTDQDPMDRQG